MRFTTQVLMFLFLFSTIAFGRIIRVPGNAEDIQSGIAAASRDDGDTILVSEGFYPDTISFAGKRIVLASRFLLNHSWETVENTIIDAVWDTTVVTFTGAETNETVLMGFTIRHGRSTVGGGINCTNADPTISNCLITENIAWTASGRGGAIYCGTGEPILDNVRIIGNQSDGDGAGLYCNGTNITIINTLFADNNAEDQGGAIYFTGAATTADISRTLMVGNGARYGGAIYVNATHRDGINLDRLTMYGNGSDHENSGALDVRGGYVNVINCILWSNGGCFAASSTGHPTAMPISYCDAQNGEDGISIDARYYDWGEGNIDRDPRFVDRNNDDFTLLENSPCIDTGDPDSPPDPDGSRADMGRHYFPQSGLAWGYVLNAEDDSPLFGTVRMFNDFSERFAHTGENGMWVIEAATIGNFSITASGIGFNDSTITDLQLEANQELQVETIRLLHPTFEPSLDQLYLQLMPDSSADLEFTIANNGNGPLEWDVRKSVSGGVGIDPWTLRDTFFVTEMLGDDQIQGVVLVDDHYYAAGKFFTRDSSMIYILNMDGDSVGIFKQLGTSMNGYSDMDYDGETIWGVESNRVYGFTIEGDSVTSFSALATLCGVAWDPDREVLWLARTTVGTPIRAYDRNGNFIVAVERFEFTITGLAYYPEDPDGYPLYVFHRLNDQMTIHKIRPEEGNEDTLFVAALQHPYEGRPQGASISCNYDDIGSWVFINVASNTANSRGDRIDVWQLASFSGWMTLDPVGNLDVLPPQSEQNFTVSLTTFGPERRFTLPEGVYEGQILFTHNAAVGEMLIPVTMRIDPEAVNESRTAIPTELAISGIYPNPFNSMTTITYNLPTTGLISMGLYDIQGRFVTLLEDGVFTAGYHQTFVSAEDLPSGLYFVRLEASQGVKTQKIALIR